MADLIRDEEPETRRVYLVRTCLPSETKLSRLAGNSNCVTADRANDRGRYARACPAIDESIVRW